MVWFCGWSLHFWRIGDLGYLLWKSSRSLGLQVHSPPAVLEYCTLIIWNQNLSGAPSLVSLFQFQVMACLFFFFFFFLFFSNKKYFGVISNVNKSYKGKTGNFYIPLTQFQFPLMFSSYIVILHIFVKTE